MHFRITGQRCRKKIILFNSVIIRGEKIISGQHERDGFERFENKKVDKQCKQRKLDCVMSDWYINRFGKLFDKWQFILQSLYSLSSLC